MKYVIFALAVALATSVAPETSIAGAPPTASNDSVVTNEDNSALFNFTADDPDGPNSQLVYTIVDPPNLGSLVQSGSKASRHVYTPTADYNGEDRATFYATDNTGLDSPVATVTFIISPKNDNAIPSAATYNLPILDENSAQLVGSDIDDNAAGIEYFITTQAQFATVTVSQTTGVFTYTPNQPSFAGSDSFGFKVKDQSSSTRSPEATVAVLRTADLSLLQNTINAYGTHTTLQNSEIESTTPSTRLVKLPLDDWQFDPGQSAFFPAIADDGTKFVANFTPVFNSLAQTACTMIITCFNDEAEACFDSGTGTSRNLSHIRVEADSGGFFVPSAGAPDCANLPAPGSAYGADVADLEVFTDGYGEERLAFVSGQGALAGGPDPFPAFGTLHKVSGSWRLDPSSLVFADEMLASQNPTDVACAPSSGLPETLPSQLEGCGVLNELGVLPVSGHLVAGMYLGDRLIVLDPNPELDLNNPSPTVAGHAEIVAAHQIPHPSIDPGNGVCDYDHGVCALPLFSGVSCSTNVDCDAVTYPGNVCRQPALFPRSVEVDPTSVAGDERFVVAYDSVGSDQGGFFQEFSYDSVAGTIAPVTALVTAVSPSKGTIINCDPQPGFPGAMPVYDSHGNLWVTQGTAADNALHVYFKNGGERSIASRCSYYTDSPVNQQPRDYGFKCESDLDIAPASVSVGDPHWRFPRGAVDLLYDEAEDAVVYVSASGDLRRIVQAEAGTVDAYTVTSEYVDIPIEVLQYQAGVPGNAPVMHKAVLDTAVRRLWIPVSENQPNASVGAVATSYLFSVAIDDLTGQQAEVTSLSAPQSLLAGASFSVEATANFSPVLDLTNSGLYFYADATVDDYERFDVSVSNCLGGQCVFSAEVPAGKLLAGPDHATWRLILVRGEGDSTTLHTAGRIAID